MPAYTVRDLVDQVRSKLDEQNTSGVDDVIDILPALNRGQEAAAFVLATHYPEPLLAQTTFILTSAQEYDMPDDCFDDRIQKLEVQDGGANGVYREVRRRSYRDLTGHDGQAQAGVIEYYMIVGRKIRVVPPPGSSPGTVRMWYLRQPARLVLPQGRVTRVVAASDYVVVDTLGTDLSTDSDSLASYISIIDPATGLSRGSGQVSSTSTGGRIQFRSTPARSSVSGITIAGGLPVGTAPDDQVALVPGTSVAPFGTTVTNYLIEYATAEMRFRGESQLATAQEQLLEAFERRVQQTWVRRESTLRIRRRSSTWANLPYRWRGMS